MELAELRDALAYAAQKQDAMERELKALAAKVASLEARLLTAAKTDVSVAAGGPVETSGDFLENLPQFDDVEPVMVKVLAAAAMAAVGRRVRLLSAHLLPPAADAVSAWSQQGRFIVQTSHNIR
jgi:phage shock protein A